MTILPAQPKSSILSEFPQNMTTLSEMRNMQKSDIALYTGGS
jgi:hypothetical protein